MALTNEQIAEMEKAVKPLMDWLEENCNPHVHVLVDSQDAVLVEGVAAIRKDFLDKKRPSKF